MRGGNEHHTAAAAAAVRNAKVPKIGHSLSARNAAEVVAARPSISSLKGKLPPRIDGGSRRRRRNKRRRTMKKMY